MSRFIYLYCFVLLLILVQERSCQTFCTNADCLYYVLFEDETSKIVRGYPTVADVEEGIKSGKSLNFNAIVGSKACTTYPVKTCSEHGECTAGNNESLYYTCACTESHYLENKSYTSYSCENVTASPTEEMLTEVTASPTEETPSASPTEEMPTGTNRATSSTPYDDIVYLVMIAIMLLISL